MNSSIPIIALTADVTTVDLEKCKAVGMNDYLAKPIDEKLLYKKIATLVKKVNQEKQAISTGEVLNEHAKCINLTYLNKRTKSNPEMMMEMIAVYLEQTPPLIISMKESLANKDWQALHAAVHKIIPSFSIMGIGEDSENIAKKVQEYAKTQQETVVMSKLIAQLELMCVQACKELEEEYNTIKQSKK